MFEYNSHVFILASLYHHQVFPKKKVFGFAASSTVIPALLKGDLISIPHFPFAVRFVMILSRLAARKGFSLDIRSPTSSTLTLIPCDCISQK